MRFTKYPKWAGIDWDNINLQQLVDALTEQLQQSGLQNQGGPRLVGQLCLLHPRSQIRFR